MSLFDDASLVLTPNGYKASKLYSIKPTSGAGDMTVVRATTATRVNSAGVIESVAINVPRLDYTGGGCPSILVEPLRTNVVLYSGDLSQSIWSKSNYALTSATAIQGLTTTRITKNATNNGYYLGSGSRNVINSVGTFASGIKTLTWLIKKGNTDKVGFVINSVLVGASTSVNCEFNFTTQTFTNISSGLTASFQNPSTDVYKITLTINDIGVLTTKAIWIAPINSSNDTVDGGYLDFAFAQWEAGSTATSYIPTTTATVTRNADVISKTGVSSLIGQTEGTIFWDVKDLAGTTATGNLDFGIRNNALGYSITITTNTLANPFRVQVKGASGILINYAANITTAKACVKYGTFGAKLFLNGNPTPVATSPTNPNFSSLDLIDIKGTNTSYKTNSFMLYTTALTDAQCITLTTP
jgi:hypothetical protein